MTPPADSGTAAALKGNRSGGAAGAGGLNFQAAVGAVALVQLARGAPLLWLDDLVHDVPVLVDAETGGGGDDIRLLLEDGRSVEVQVKKGLRSGPELWQALLDLARAIGTDAADFGLLVVSPGSSRTIGDRLARDIRRLGDGRRDDLAPIGAEFVARLEAAGLEPELVCRRLRIRTIAAAASEQADIRAARAELAHLTASRGQVGDAWNALLLDSHGLIEHRGRRDASAVVRILRSADIRLRDEAASPALLVDRLARWSMRAHEHFTILGASLALATDHAWIPLTASVRDHADFLNPVPLDEALRSYQSWESRTAPRDAQPVDPETLCRFVTRSVLVAGPGMGKTTLLKRIARRYSEDALPVLNVRLSLVAARMRDGDSFEEAIFALGLDGSGIGSAEARAARLPNWVLLCDGLDECGGEQELVAAGIARFSAGHPDCRILVTTRPIGYQATAFSAWRHYELGALSHWEAWRHAATLVEAITPPGTAIHEQAADICREQLRGALIPEIVGRTPLLLSLAAALIARGRRLGETRERLFEQIFDLIDALPAKPIATELAPPTVLRHFLDSLGWQIGCQPLAPVGTILAAAAADLARETGRPRLAALADAERMLGYWEAVGMVERIGFPGQQIFAFIHKSLGEYAAARHLLALPPPERTAAIAARIDAPAFAETWRFAGAMGLADPLAAALLAEPRARTEAARIGFALDLMAQAEPPPAEALRHEIVTRAFTLIAGPRERLAVPVGKAAVAAARRFPQEVGPTATRLLEAPHAWTRLCAWTCAVAAGPEHFPLDRLEPALREALTGIGPGVTPMPGGGISLGWREEHDLAEELLLDACGQFLERMPAEAADVIVPDLLNHPCFGSVNFLFRARALARRHGRAYQIGKAEKEWFTGWNERFLEGRTLFYTALFDLLGIAPDEPAGREADTPPLLHFSAFIAVAQLDELPVNDHWAWGQPFDRDAARGTLHAFIEICGIDRDKLRQEALRAKAYLRDDPLASQYLLLAVTPQVDAPPVDWSRIRSVKVDPADLERSLRHPSRWIRWLAVNMLGALLDPPAIEALLATLLNDGSGSILWAAAGLAQELGSERGDALVMARLREPLSPGCDHLFDYLEQRPSLDPALLLPVLRAGLFSARVEIALAAAEVVAKHATLSLSGAAAMLEEALAHWSIHEVPYPTSGGLVPISPRATIATALLKIRPARYAELRAYRKDSRPDVAEVGSAALLARLGPPDSLLTDYLADIEATGASAQVLTKALKARIGLAPDEVDGVARLLADARRQVRFAAMPLIDHQYMSAGQVAQWVRILSEDPDEHIREAAFAIRDRMAE